MLVFGDAYIEVVWWGSIPVALYNLDSPTTTPIADVHGNITGYVQVTDYGQKASFEAREVIHISLDSARPGVVGISPMQAALGPVTAWLFAAATGKEEFKKGLPPNIHADFPAAAPEKDIRTWRDQYQTRNIGARNIGAPIVSKGGVTLKELQTGKIGDVIAGKNQCRDEILSIFGVPPAKAGVIESGNLGGGTGDAQDKTYRIDTCGPIEELVAEALNYALTTQAFKITDWEMKFGEVDYRDSAIIENIRDQRLRNGAWTLNRYRAEIGEPPVPGGDDAILVDRQNLVLWADMQAMSAAVVASKGAPAVAAGEQQPNGNGPGVSDPGGGAAPPQEESLRGGQIARYQARLEEALARMRQVTESSKSTADEVYEQLSENFPPDVIKWVKAADWTGPVNVPADHIDLADRDSWAASKDGRVPKFRAKLKRKQADGKHLKPVILVRTPGSDNDVIADGHHRVLASIDEGEPVWAYVGRVDERLGPWNAMHSSQAGGNR
jgi:HK97 family phage portal protein